MIEDYVKNDRRPFPIHTTFIMDRFTDFGKIPCCAMKMLMARRCGYACMLLLPSLSALRDLYADMNEWKGIAASCAAVLPLDREQDPFLSKWLAEYREENRERPGGAVYTVYQVLPPEQG